MIQLMAILKMNDVKNNKVGFYFKNLRPVKLMTHINCYFILALVMAFTFTLNSCKKEIKNQPPITLPPTIKYLKLELSTGHQIQISQKESYRYELTTTGEDPYLFMMPLTASNHPDSVVFTFEYQCSTDISNFQIFFGSSITEERSLKPGTIPASNGWNSYTIDLSDKIKQFSWGYIGDFLRLDFGTSSGIKFQIRNIHLRALNAEEKKEALEREEIITNDLLLESNLKKYLSTNYGSQITEVKVGPSTINIIGNYTGEGDFGLCEVAPYEHVTQINKFATKYPLSDPVFSIDIDRFGIRNGLMYDRLLSKWIIVKIGALSDEIVSHAKYASQIVPLQTMVAKRATGKKGLGGYSVSRGGMEKDLDDLGISSVTVNITLTSLMYIQPHANTIEHTYGDKIYYFDVNQVEDLDRTMQSALSRNIVVAAIILIQKASECADPEVGRLLQHPNYTSEGIYTMPNLTSPESVNCYAAGLDFLARRYCRSDNYYGRIHHWIMHNEVDAGLSWTNMGEKPMLVYMDTYIKSMRLCYNIARKYDENCEVFGSFTHSWAAAVEPKYYATKEMLKTLLDYSGAEGDFKWGLAYHPYPDNLFEPKTWNDQNATFSMNTRKITFKNLEVLDTWIKKPENKYLGNVKRTVWLSENGTNSKTYGEQDLKEQAAGFAYTWKKLKTLDGIDAMQWHNWMDNRFEGGLMIGLHRFGDDQTDPAGRKPVWFAYQAAGTNQEDSVFEPYKSVIGIQSWDEVLHLSPIQ